MYHGLFRSLHEPLGQLRNGDRRLAWRGAATAIHAPRGQTVRRFKWPSRSRHSRQRGRTRGSQVRNRRARKINKGDDLSGAPGGTSFACWERQGLSRFNWQRVTGPPFHAGVHSLSTTVGVRAPRPPAGWLAAAPLKPPRSSPRLRAPPRACSVRGGNHTSRRWVFAAPPEPPSLVAALTRAASCLLSQGGHSRPTTLGVRDPP